MKIKVSEATNLQLDWLVARCVAFGVNHIRIINGEVTIKDGDTLIPCRFTTDPAQGLPIIEREGMHLDGPSRSVGDKTWYATHPASMTIGSGPTILVAGMRCYVASRMGLEVEIPEGLK